MPLSSHRKQWQCRRNFSNFTVNSSSQTGVIPSPGLTQRPFPVHPWTWQPASRHLVLEKILFFRAWIQDCPFHLTPWRKMQPGHQYRICRKERPCHCNAPRNMVLISPELCPFSTPMWFLPGYVSSGLHERASWSRLFQPLDMWISAQSWSPPHNSYPIHRRTAPLSSGQVITFFIKVGSICLKWDWGRSNWVGLILDSFSVPLPTTYWAFLKAPGPCLIIPDIEGWIRCLLAHYENYPTSKRSIFVKWFCSL